MSMRQPNYITLEQAREVLSELGVELNERQIKRASEKDAHGRRKLPFFIDPIDKKLKIEKGTLLAIYNQCQIEAEESAYAKVFNTATTKNDLHGTEDDRT